MYTIYKISCLKNNKVYIGQTTIIKTRKRDHYGKLKRCEHHNPYIQYDYNLYGSDMFIFEIIEECEFKEEALNRETYWINFLPFSSHSLGRNIEFKVSLNDGLLSIFDVSRFFWLE